MTEIRVHASSEYSVLIGRGLLERCGEYIRNISGAEKVMLVCGDTVEALYAERAEASLSSAGFEVSRFVYPHGEQQKSLAVLGSLLNAMAEHGMSRSDLAVALGGGVTGDICGFASACYMRGIDYVQIPTTLLAMVDSSVGGKTAVDLDSGKNLAGAFHQPRLVLCDTETLDTLPDAIFAEGCAEAVKCAVLRDTELLSLLSSPRENAQEIIRRCVTLKRDLVEADEHDRGERRLLNLGHTLAHAIEKYTCYTVSHGEAVAMGLSVMTKGAAAVVEALSSLGLPTECKYDKEELCKLMLADKKRSGDTLTLAVPHSLGCCELKEIKVSELKSFIFGC